MIIRPPSQQKPWDVYCSKDSAFKQPPKPPADDASDEERAEYLVTIEKYRATLKACQQTGDWSSLLVEGGQPVKFTLGPVPGSVWRAIIDRSILPVDSHRRIGPVMLRSLLFRLSVKSIAGWDKFERLPDPAWDNWTMAPASVAEQLDEIDPSIVGEIGDVILDRLQGGRPLS